MRLSCFKARDVSQCLRCDAMRHDEKKYGIEGGNCTDDYRPIISFSSFPLHLFKVDWRMVFCTLCPFPVWRGEMSSVRDILFSMNSRISIMTNSTSGSVYIGMDDLDDDMMSYRWVWGGVLILFQIRCYSRIHGFRIVMVVALCFERRD